MSQLTIVRGLPGSGKTTFANALPEAQRFAADDLFETPEGYKFDPQKLEEAHKLCQLNTLRALQDGDVIVHNTFTTADEFSPYLSMASTVDVVFVVYDLFDGGLTDEELANRNTHGVPETTIARMRARWTRAPISEMHVSFVDGFAHWQRPVVEDGVLVYKPDWLDMRGR